MCSTRFEWILPDAGAPYSVSGASGSGRAKAPVPTGGSRGRLRHFRALMPGGSGLTRDMDLPRARCGGRALLRAAAARGVQPAFTSGSTRRSASPPAAAKSAPVWPGRGARARLGRREGRPATARTLNEQRPDDAHQNDRERHDHDDDGGRVRAHPARHTIAKRSECTRHAGTPSSARAASAASRRPGGPQMK